MSDNERTIIASRPTRYGQINGVFKMAQEEAIAAIQSILAAEPDLAWSGYRAGFIRAKASADFADARARLLSLGSAKEFLQANVYLDSIPAGRRQMIKAHDSYILKHAAERWSPNSNDFSSGHYVSNGVFIIAAIYRGFTIKPIPNTLNAMVGERCGAFDWPLPREYSRWRQDDDQRGRPH